MSHHYQHMIKKISGHKKQIEEVTIRHVSLNYSEKREAITTYISWNKNHLNKATTSHMSLNAWTQDCHINHTYKNR